MSKFQYLYLIQTNDCRKFGDDVYYLGTVDTNYQSIQEMLNHNGKNALILSIFNVKNAEQAYSIIYKQFKKRFTIVCFYDKIFFLGDVSKMIHTLISYVHLFEDSYQDLCYDRYIDEN